jgi:radical SAM superfamily enzyme YgiQ (UPF0313 family)
METVRVLLISTYDLGRQPFGLASPTAWLRSEGIEVDCVDASRDALSDSQIGRAGMIAFYLPMHTATRLAAPLVSRVRRLNPSARLAAYGLYAPLNAAWLRESGVEHVFGPESEADLVRLAQSAERGSLNHEPGTRTPNTPAFARSASARSRRSVGGGGNLELATRNQERQVQRLRFIQPDRSTLPPLSRYAALQMPDGSRRIVGSTEATRGC